MTKSIAFAAMLQLVGSTLVFAQQPAEPPPSKSVDQVFARYKQARESEDWKALFLLGTPDHQNQEVLRVAFELSQLDGKALKQLSNDFGFDVAAFDRALIEYEQSDAEERERDRRFRSAASAAIARMSKKPEFFEAAQKHMNNPGNEETYEIKELKGVAYQADTASGVAIAKWTTLSDYSDYPNGPVRPARRSVRWEIPLTFRKLNDNWYLATTEEVEKLNAEVQP